MFDIGISEMVLLAAIALVAIGPKQLPEVARTVGRLINEFKRATGDFGKSFTDIRNDALRSINEASDSLNRTVQETESKILAQNQLNQDTTSPNQAHTGDHAHDHDGGHHHGHHHDHDHDHAHHHGHDDGHDSSHDGHHDGLDDHQQMNFALETSANAPEDSQMSLTNDTTTTDSTKTERKGS
jgi:Tat protein translocase TatB subunit